MNKRKITITRALAELKLYDKKIDKAIRESAFATFKVNGKNHNTNYTPKADLQKVNDLIENRSAIKTGIMKSNAKTKVTVADEKMTVVQAIEMKDSIKYKKLLAKKMLQDIGQNTARIDDINDEVHDRLDSVVRAALGNDAKTSGNEYDAIAKPFLESNQAVNVDDGNYLNLAKKLSDEVDEFESEVDLVLTESNSTTYIEV